MKDNALLNFEGAPRFADIRPQQADAAVDAILADLDAAADAAARAAPNWEAMWAPLSAAEEAAERVWNQIEHMHSVSDTPPWRKAHQRNLPKIAAAHARLGQHQGMRDNLMKLAKTSMPPLRRKIVQDALRDFELSGAGLPPAKKNQFRKNSERLAALSARFEENLLDATADRSQAIAVADEGALGGMPADLKNAARAKKGGWSFSLTPPSYIALMRYSPARHLRETMYYRHSTRASEFGPARRDNSPLIKEILQLRARQAKLLGFSSYAELALQTRMAKSPKQVADFLRTLATKALPAARREMQEMRDFAAAELEIKDLQPWDMLFVAEHLRRRRFDFDAAELRPYLKLDKALDGLFGCVKKLFGVRLRPAAADKWRDDVQYYEVQNGDGKKLGGLYLDLFARDNKRGGAWMAEALSRCRRRGRLQLPLAHVACNFTPPSGGGAALLNWEEAQTLFHEFGHALHHVLTEVEEYAASGLSGVEWDAVELPSQFMENFLWDWRILRPMTAHAETGKPMPKRLFNKALSARRFQSGLGLIRQLDFALFDLELHRNKPADFMKVLSAVRRETAVMEMPKWNRFPCGFSHIFAGGYAAGYYSYLWAEALSADAFAMFEESGDILSPHLGAKFRREILAAGGSRAAAESFAALRGRAPDSAPLLKHYGLA